MLYSSENHNWDLTIMSSSKLVALGRLLTSGKDSFSAFSGSMLLAVVGLESFLNSVGFMISQDDSTFLFDVYENKSIEDKIDILIKRYSLDLSKDRRPYQTIKTAVKWRNSIAHSKPTYTGVQPIHSAQAVKSVKQYHASNKRNYPPYERMVNEKNANRFNKDIVCLIEAIELHTGVKPRACSTYRP